MFNNLNINLNKNPRNSAFIKKIAGVNGGVSVIGRELKQKVVYSGTPLGKDANGLYHVIKTATLVANAEKNSQIIKISKFHNFLPGDLIAFSSLSQTVKISSIDQENFLDVDILNLSQSLNENLNASEIVFQTKSSNQDFQFVYKPVGLCGTSFIIEDEDYYFTDCVTKAMVRLAACPPMPKRLLEEFKDIIFI